MPSDISPFASVDGNTARRSAVFGCSKDGPRTRTTSIAVTPLVAQRLGLHVGDVLSLYLGGGEALFGPPTGAKPRPVHVVGLIAMQGGFPPLTGGLPPPALLAPSYATRIPTAVR